MKLNRLLTMTMILINRKKVKAQEFAELFDVSIRTVYRDVEALSSAGIPVISYQGADGGISLIDGYRIDKQILTKEELNSMSIALKSVLTAYQDPHAEAVLEKITGIAGDKDKSSIDYVFIDESPWGQSVYVKEKLTIVKQAIEASICVKFTYSDSNKLVTSRTIEPHTLVQKGRTWYVYGYCLLKNEFRLFKLARIKDLQLCNESFIRKAINLSELPWDKAWYSPENTVSLKLAFHPDIRLKMVDMFGVELIEDGQSIVKVEIPEDEWLYGFILSFTDKVEVLEPIHIREIIKDKVRKMFHIYEKNK
ncbi:helix-turn-helix transcriptional regulator [Sporosarcina limicola]|uniref:DNA-binding transcriptional regulator YafY n=1 Tax=Sporosarcina limicola TaxID=34101 RepID=A0A927RFT2_9BACL|nr:YafY family protein [Sporosarcina limicola]MBE1555842.1 putative DNA-binding transcriptional regulator YafY [Sporosarcina limicola]